ncbi:MAG: TraU, partial [uncultured bacterium]
MKGMVKLLILPFIFLLSAAHAKCEGSFVNPITDICWDCLFPISIGSMNVVSGDYPDTDNPALPI